MAYHKIDDESKDPVMTEEKVVSKITELMETLDHIKKYNALARSLKKFALAIIISVAIFICASIFLAATGIIETNNRPIAFIAGFTLLLIPIIGLVIGVMYVRKRVNSVKTGEWRQELSNGFPSALKILMELDWDKTFDEISIGKIGYAFYGLLKTGAYWFVTFFALDIVLKAATLYLFNVPVEGGFVLGLFAFLLVLLVLGNNLLRRYKELQSLDMLLWELRWFSLELRRNEFKT